MNKLKTKIPLNLNWQRRQQKRNLILQKKRSTERNYQNVYPENGSVCKYVKCVIISLDVFFCTIENAQEKKIFGKNHGFDNICIGMSNV